MAQITGLTPAQVKQTILSVRKRLLEPPTGGPMAPMRVWDARSRILHYTDSLDGLGPKKQLRIMPWTGYIDANRRRIYLWDIVQAEGKTAVVTRWRNQLGSGYSPFGTDTRVDWLGSAVVIGDVYTTPERMTERTNEQTNEGR